MNCDEEHIRHVCAVLQALVHRKLLIQSKKCAFMVSTVNFLGYIVSGKDLEVDPAKVRIPLQKSAVFMVCPSFYRHFIKGFSDNTTLVELSRSKTFRWTDKATPTFDLIK